MLRIFIRIAVLLARVAAHQETARRDPAEDDAAEFAFHARVQAALQAHTGLFDKPGDAVLREVPHEPAARARRHVLVRVAGHGVHVTREGRAAVRGELPDDIGGFVIAGGEVVGDLEEGTLLFRHHVGHGHHLFGRFDSNQRFPFPLAFLTESTPCTKCQKKYHCRDTICSSNHHLPFPYAYRCIAVYVPWILHLLRHVSRVYFSDQEKCKSTSLVIFVFVLILGT
ncbi:MAG: hypothetical protein BWY09_03066 [Candidatus Hydrogenedentes bacterium ADurb.Bin179]|nr:MAG: hypothetical protein BWY09_03066 [Candidatus Hydrogenedentes bacterium ADurb.Bin179]